MTNKSTLALGLMIIGLSIPTFPTPKDAFSKIDRTIIQKVDLTHDGKPERIVIHITGDSIRSPFTVTIEIYSQSKRIFFKKEVESPQWDANFNDPEFVGNCDDYVTCKKKWYFKDMMNFLYPLPPWSSDIIAKDHSANLKLLLIRTGKSTITEAEKIIETLIKHIQSGNAIAIALSAGPQHPGSVKLWIPVVDDFVGISWW